MFKYRKFQFFCLPLIALLLLVHSAPLTASTTCIADCKQCSNPYTCQKIPDFLNPNRNNNCLPFSYGDACSQGSHAFESISSDSLKGWSASEGQTSQKKCKILGEGTESLKEFDVLGEFSATQVLTKNIKIELQDVSVLLIKMAFTFHADYSYNISIDETTPNETQPEAIDPQNSFINPDGTPNLPGDTVTESEVTVTEKNLTHRSFLDVKIVEIGETLELNYPLEISSLGTPVNSTCGVRFSFLKILSIPSDIRSITIELTPVAGTESQWAIGRFEVYAGCSGFTFSSPNGQCDLCQSGFFPVYNPDRSVLECGICQSECLTCTEISCTSCVAGAKLNIESGQCELSSNFARVPPQLEEKRKITSTNPYLYNIIPDSSDVIELNTVLPSTKSLSIRFFILYTNSIILNRQAVFEIYQETTLLRTITVRELRNLNGVYLKAASAKEKVFLHKVVIEGLNVTNKNFKISVQLKSEQLNNPFWVANYEIIQFKCSDKCDECDRETGVCTKCADFFMLNAENSCESCPNGFFLKRTWDQPIQTPNGDTILSSVRTAPDICIKCHSSCKQCIGPELSDCSECFIYFQIEKYFYNNDCIECMYNRFKNPLQPIPEKCSQCFLSHSFDFVNTNSECNYCMNSSKLADVTVGFSCETCWRANKLAHGHCVPTTDSTFSYFGSDIESGVIEERNWKSSRGKFEKFTCTSDYQDIWGVKPEAAVDGVLKDFEIIWSEKDLPQHTGLALFINIFKINITEPGGQIEVQLSDEDQNISILEKVSLNNSVGGGKFDPVGSDICGGSGNQMIYSYTFDSLKHSSNELNMKIKVKGGGIYLRQLEVYLGNCGECEKNQLVYQAQYLPRYYYNTTAKPTGLDIWLEFSNKISKQSDSALKNSFEFRIDKLYDNNALPISEFDNEMELNKRIHYFIALTESFINGSLLIDKSRDSRIFADPNKSRRRRMLQGALRRSLLNSRLNTLQSEGIVDRFSFAEKDDSITMEQIYWFFKFFQWFALILMIVFALLGIGVVFEEFSILLQLLFLHVYISSSLLPATFKAPIEGLQKMENLNYFDYKSEQEIEWSWFGQYEHPSPYIFQQYNKDIYFARNFYPTIIINILYLCWFLLLLVLRKCIKPFRESKSVVAQFFRNITDRPINYFDQIWRYQFITTMWVSFMQFFIIKNDTAAERTNLALCFISFIISLVWPIFVISYTYYITNYKYSSEFLYYFEDIFFKKMVTTSERDFKYYMYIAVRFGRYLVITLFIAVFTYHEIVGPIILICVNIIEMIYVTNLKIWNRSLLGPALKVIENILFIFVEIAFLFVYGFSNSIDDRAFLNLGYALVVLYVIMVIVGLVRVGHHFYLKFKNYRENNSYGRDAGEKVERKHTPIPQMEMQRMNDE